MTVFSAATLLFLVLDPFGNIPFFIAALESVERERHLKVILRELLIAFAVLVAFLLGGQYVLRLLHVSEPALSAAGGTVLFLIAIRMVFPRPGAPSTKSSPASPSSCRSPFPTSPARRRSRRCSSS